jgi:hypothetical protein
MSAALFNALILAVAAAASAAVFLLVGRRLFISAPPGSRGR